MVIASPPLVGPREAARRLALSVDQVRNLAYQNVLPAIRLADDSGRLVFPLDAVIDLAKQRASRKDSHA
jgi:hypothetical protein